MPQSDDEPSQMAAAYGWAGRVTTVVVEMVLPALGGRWLDSRFGTQYWVIVGFAAGFALGLFHLLQMVKQQESDIPPPSNNSAPDDKK